MFERYTEPARRALFFSRYESSEQGIPSILPEHLLLGIIREGGGLIREMFSSAGLSLEDVRAHFEQSAKVGAAFSTSVEIPFAEGARRALLYAAEEADRLSHSSIGSPHLLLGLLRLDGERLWSYLTEHGLTLESCRKLVQLGWTDEDRHAR